MNTDLMVWAAIEHIVFLLVAVPFCIVAGVVAWNFGKAQHEAGATWPGARPHPTKAHTGVPHESKL